MEFAHSPEGVGVGVAGTLFLLGCNIAATVAVYHIAVAYLVNHATGVPDFIAGLLGLLLGRALLVPFRPLVVVVVVVV